MTLHDPDLATCVSCGDPSEQQIGWCDTHALDDTYVCELCGALTDEDPCRNHGIVWCDWCAPCDELCRVHD